MATASRNISFSLTGFIVHVVATFLLSPILLRELGPVRYGLWALAMATIGYYSLLDFGLRASVVQRLARAIGLKRQHYVNRLVSAGTAVTVIIALLIFSVTVVTVIILQLTQFVEAGLKKELVQSLLILGTGMAIQFVLFPAASILVAAGRIDIDQGVTTAARIVSAICTYYAVLVWPSLPIVALAFSVPAVLASLAQATVAIRYIFPTRLHRRFVSRRTLRLFGMSSFWNFASASSTRISNQTDNFTVAAFAGAASVATFSLAANLMDYGRSIFTSVNRVVLPMAAQLHAEKRREELARLLMNTIRFLLLASIPFVFISALSAHPFFELWLGDSIDLAGCTHHPAKIYQILSPAIICFTAGLPSRTILVVLGKYPRNGALSITEATSNLALSIALAIPFDQVGIAIGTLIPSIGVSLLARPFSAFRASGTPFDCYFSRCLWRPVASLVVYCVPICVIWRTVTLDSWTALVVFGASCVTIAAVATFFVGLTTTERHGLLAKALSSTRLARQSKCVSELRRSR